MPGFKKISNKYAEAKLAALERLSEDSAYVNQLNPWCLTELAAKKRYVSKHQKEDYAESSINDYLSMVYDSNVESYDHGQRFLSLVNNSQTFYSGGGVTTTIYGGNNGGSYHGYTPDTSSTRFGM